MSMTGGAQDSKRNAQFEQAGVYGTGDPFAVGPATRHRLSEENLANHTLNFNSLPLNAEADKFKPSGKKAEANPWGEGATTLEWSLSSPPPYHQFETLPRID